MKRFLLLFITFSCSWLLHAEVIQKTYTFDHYQLTPAQRNFSTFRLDDAQLYAKIGEPEIPYVSVMLALPFGTKATSFDVEFSDEVVVPGEQSILPYQGLQPYSIPAGDIFHQSREVYAADMDYPRLKKGILNTHYMNGYGIAVTVFTPMHYNPATKKLSYYRNATISVTVEKVDPSVQYEMLSSNPSVIKRVKDAVQNPEILDTYPVVRASEEYQMLIVTGDSYKNSFTDLINHYAQQKLTVKVVSTSEISYRTEGRDTQEKIRNYILEEYKNNKIKYVLLGGDVQVIPARYFYCAILCTDGSSYKKNIPADVYYSALDGTWNKNNNSKWGEIEDQDSIDLFPDIAVGRLPFQNSQQLTTMLTKNLSYQKTPVMNEITKPLLFGEVLDAQTHGKAGLELLVGHKEANGIVTDGIPQESNTIVTLWEPGQGGTSKNQVLQKINGGVSFIYHSGHANENTVMKFYSSDITDQNFNNIDGKEHNYSLITSTGCICGAFDKNDCIMERMLKINKFAVAVIGNSNFGLYNQGKSDGPSDHLMRRFVDGLYGKEQYRIGDALSYSKTKVAPYVTSVPIAQAPDSGGVRWAYYVNNLLGDPAMIVWIKDGQTSVSEKMFQNTQSPALLKVSAISAHNIVISCNLEKPMKVHAAIFNAKGQMVYAFKREHMSKGMHQLIWNGMCTNGSPAGTGCYFARIQTPAFTETQGFTLAK